MSYSELALVWTDLRGVSKFFHTEVEALFERSVLLGTTVDFYWCMSFFQSPSPAFKDRVWC